MRNLIVLLMVSFFALMPNWVSEVIAQQVSENLQPSPTRPEEQAPRDLSAAGSATPQTSPNSNYQRLYFDQHNRSSAASRNLSFSNKYHYNDSLTDIVSSVMATKRNKLTLTQTGMMMDSGLSYALPVSQKFSAFASLQPSLTAPMQTINAPHTMMVAGFMVPLTNKTTSGQQDLSLKFSTAVDQQYRPVFFFSLNLMSLGRK